MAGSVSEPSGREWAVFPPILKKKKWKLWDIPIEYLKTHNKLSFWEKMKMEEIAGGLMAEDREIMKSYN